MSILNKCPKCNKTYKSLKYFKNHENKCKFKEDEDINKEFNEQEDINKKIKEFKELPEIKELLELVNNYNEFVEKSFIKNYIYFHNGDEKNYINSRNNLDIIVKDFNKDLLNLLNKI